MWTATIKQVRKMQSGLMLAFSVEFSDGTKTLTVPYNYHNIKELELGVRNQVKQLEEIETYFAEDHVGELVNYAPAAPEVVEPTPEQLAEREYEQKRQELIQLQNRLEQDVKVGLCTKEDMDTQIAEKLTSAQTAKTALSDAKAAAVIVNP
jgi:hypothetical protein